MRHTIIPCALCALAVMSVATEARAEANPEAKRLFKEAMTAYNAGEWAEAATGFMQAYQAQPEAVFLYNAAKARGALAGDDPAKLEAALKLLERAQAQTERPLSDKLKAKAAEYNGELVAKIEEAKRLKEERRQAELDALKGNPDNYTRMGLVGWTGVGVLAAGGISMGVAGYFNNQVRLASEGLEGPDASRAEYDRLATDFTSNQGAGQLSLYVGGALIAVGTGLLVWDLVTLEYEQPVGDDTPLKESKTGGVRIGVTPGGARLEVTF